MDNPPNNPNYAFRFGPRPVRILTQAIEALCDLQFNPTGTGRIDVYSTATVGLFAITTRSPLNVAGLLYLRALESDNFLCRTPILGNKFVYLRRILTNLNGHDQDTVTILQDEGSNQITFQFGEDTTQPFTAELFENNNQTPGGKIEKFPSFRSFCWTYLPSHDMQLLANQMIRDGIFQPVSVLINENETRVVIENGHPMIYNLDNMYPNFTGGVMFPWHKHYATFTWFNPEVLLRAARLSPYYSVCFSTDQATNVIFRFTHPQLGELYFLRRASRVTTIERRYSEVLASS